jgi:hypothetical protein
LNKVQEEKKSRIIFIKDQTLIPVVENIIKDLELKYDKKEFKNRTRYKILPPLKKTPKIELSDFEALRDELLEEGQLF